MSADQDMDELTKAKAAAHGFSMRLQDAEAVSEELAHRQQEFYHFMQERCDQAIRNALREEGRTGRIAHVERAVHDEVNYLMRKFRDTVQWMDEP